jgi:hypothetical protein
MALKQCKECNNTVSNQAKTCPHCGARVRKSRWGIVILFALIVGACVIGLPIMAGRHVIVTEQKKAVVKDNVRAMVEDNVREGLKEEYGIKCTSINLIKGSENYFCGVATLEDGREIDIDDARMDGDMIRFKHIVKQGYEYKCKHHIDRLKFYISFDDKERGVLFGEIWNDGSEPIRGFIVAEFIDDKGRVYHRDREMVFYSGDLWIPPGKSAIFAFNTSEEMLKENAVNTKVEFFNLGNEPLALYNWNTIPVKITSQIYKIHKEKPSSETWRDILPLRFR